MFLYFTNSLIFFSLSTNELAKIPYFCFMDIKIFKFGGASVNSSKGVINVVSVINRFPGENIVMIVSAMGKMTNSLEELLGFYMLGNHDQMLESYKQIKDFHLRILQELFQDKNHSVFAEIQNKFHWAVHGHTASEIVHERANANAPHMGLTTWKNQ